MGNSEWLINDKCSVNEVCSQFISKSATKSAVGQQQHDVQSHVQKYGQLKYHNRLLHFHKLFPCESGQMCSTVACKFIEKYLFHVTKGWQSQQKRKVGKNFNICAYSDKKLFLRLITKLKLLSFSCYFIALFWFSEISKE